MPTRCHARSRVRFFGKFFCVGLLLTILVMASLPLWVGAVLVRVLPAEVVLGDYTAVGYGRFEARELSIQLPRVRIEVDRLAGKSVYAWYWSMLRGELDSRYLKLGVVDVWVDVEGRVAEASGELNSLPELLVLLDPILDEVFRWLPHGGCDRVRVTVGEQVIEVEDIRLRDSVLRGRVSFNGLPKTGVELCIISPELDLFGPWKLSAVEYGLEGTLNFVEADSEVLFDCKGTYQGNVGSGGARFDRSGWFPVDATWNLPSWRLAPAGLLDGLPYESLEFSLTGHWADGAYQNAIDGRLTGGRASLMDHALPDVYFQSASEGTDEVVTLKMLQVEGPGVRVDLREPIRVDLFSRQVLSPALLWVDADFDRLEVSRLRGQLKADLELMPTRAGVDGWLRVKGQALEYAEFSLRDLDLNLELEDSQWLRCDTRAVVDGVGQILASGRYDLESQLLSAGGLTLELDGTRLGAWLPESIGLGRVQLNATGEGPLANLRHQGDLSVEQIQLGTPIVESAQISWGGHGLRIERFDAVVSKGQSRYELIGQLESVDGGLRAWFENLTVLDDGGVLAELTQPAELLYDAEGRLVLKDWVLDGEAGRVELALEGAYPQRAAWELTLVNWTMQRWLRDWWTVSSMSAVDFTSLRCVGGWEEGPLGLDLEFELGLRQADDVDLLGSGGVHLGDGQARFEGVQFGDSLGPWLQVEGALPMEVFAAEAPRVRFDLDGPLRLNADISGAERWGDVFSQIAVVDLKRLDGALKLAGSIDEPKGSLRLDIATASVEGENGLPAAQVHLEGNLDGQSLMIPALHLNVLEEQFSGTARLELPSSLRSCFVDPFESHDWGRTTFELTVPRSSLSPLRYFFAATISEGGFVEAELQGSVASGVEGVLRIEDLSTRHVFPFGSIRDIQAELNFNHQEAHLSSFRGYIGQQPLTASGCVNYGGWPQTSYDFALNGAGISLLRKPGLMLRADLDLELSKAIDAAAVLSGEVDLKDGVFLQDLTALMQRPASGQSAERRPPYFSVEAEPWGAVQVDLSVQGKQFMRLDTPVVDGVLSANFALSGTLREPVSIGSVRFEDGNLLFPFARFEIDRGRIDLPVDDPFTPLLNLSGYSRRYGYDLEVEIGGTAYEPQVQFYSSPHLSSHTIMQMVVAGQSPDGQFRFSAAEAAQRFGSYLSKNIFVSRGEKGADTLDRFSMTTGGNLSKQGKETVDLELRVAERIYVTGEYDEYDFWNAGMRYRLIRPARREQTDAEGAE